MTFQAQADAPLVIEAPAKINLALHVTGQRDDGYHLLDSLVVFGGGCDRIVFRDSDHLHLTIDGPFAETLEREPDNLMVRAARLLGKALGCTPNGNLTLEKHLPIASGVGGGSADASATLLGLLRLWDRTIADEKLHQIALELGADVPMCLEGHCLRAQGIGDELDEGPILPRDMTLVLINPGVPISTPEIFKALRSKDNPTLGPMPSAFLSVAALAEWLGDQRNDLEMAAIEQAPVIDTILQALNDCDGCHFARMSGSGATCYGLFASQEEAKRAAAHLTISHPNWWVSHGRAR